MDIRDLRCPAPFPLCVAVSEVQPLQALAAGLSDQLAVHHDARRKGLVTELESSPSVVQAPVTREAQAEGGGVAVERHDAGPQQPVAGGLQKKRLIPRLPKYCCSSFLHPALFLDRSGPREDWQRNLRARIEGHANVESLRELSLLAGDFVPFLGTERLREEQLKRRRQAHAVAAVAKHAIADKPAAGHS